MTKAAMCLHCGQIIGPQPRGDAWTWCADPCAHSAVRWRDARAGLLEVTSCHGESNVAVLGLHNAFVGMLASPLTDDQWRNVHDNVTHAPGYLFDKTKRSCWAVLVRPGESGDVFFMPYGAAWLERPVNGGSAPNPPEATATNASQVTP